MKSEEAECRNFRQDVIFDRIDRKMKEERLFLDPGLTLPLFSKLTGTNRTYASKAICGRYKNFRDYVNTLRVENLLGDIQARKCGGVSLLEDTDEFANSYGFSTRRSLVKETGCTYRKIWKRRRLSQ